MFPVFIKKEPVTAGSFFFHLKGGEKHDKVRFYDIHGLTGYHSSGYGKNPRLVTEEDKRQGDDGKSQLPGALFYPKSYYCHVLL